MGDSIPVELSVRTEPMPCESAVGADCRGWRHHLHLETDFDAHWWSIEVDLDEADYSNLGGVDADAVVGRMTLVGDDNVQVTVVNTGIQLQATPTVLAVSDTCSMTEHSAGHDDETASL